MPEEKKDYLELAKLIYESAGTYDGALDKLRIRAAQAQATIAIAEELRRLNENMGLANTSKILESLNSIIEACDEPTPHIPKIKHIAERMILASDK